MNRIIKKSCCFVICLALLCACVSFVFSNSKVYALDNPPQVLCTDNDSVTKVSNANFNYYYFQNGLSSTISINNFEFVENDILTYSYIKVSSSNYVYTPLKTITFTTSDINDVNKKNGQTLFTSANVLGSGTYRIKATIVRDEVIISYPLPLHITIAPPTQTAGLLTLNIFKREVSQGNNGLSSWSISAELYQNNKMLSVNDYEIFWYFDNNDSGVPFTNKSNFVWTPSEVGIYRINAIAKVGGVNVPAQTPLDIAVKKDNTLKVVLACSGVALVMTAWVVIRTIISVKKERVW